MAVGEADGMEKRCEKNMIYEMGIPMKLESPLKKTEGELWSLVWPSKEPPSNI